MEGRPISMDDIVMHGSNHDESIISSDQQLSNDMKGGKFGVTMRTVKRWRTTGAVNTEQLLGCNDSATADEVSGAEEILDRFGQLVCLLCDVPVPANKKSIKRHQTKNRKHLSNALEIANGTRRLHPEDTLAKTAHMDQLHTRAAARHSYPRTSAAHSKQHGSSTNHYNSSGAPSSSSSSSASHSFSINNAVSSAIASDPFQPLLAREAWSIITSEEKVDHMSEMSAYLSELGVYDYNDLVFCNEGEIQHIASLLKKVPQRRFCEIFGLVSST